MRSDDLDSTDLAVRNALKADATAAQRLVARALIAPAGKTRRVPVLAAFSVAIAGAIVVARYATSEPPIVIRGDSESIVIESGSRLHRTTRTLRDDRPK